MDERGINMTIANPQTQAIQTANTMFNLAAQLMSLYTQMVALDAAWLDQGSAAVLAAMGTVIQNADGSLGTADVTPNITHPLDPTKYPSIQRSLSSNQIASFNTGIWGQVHLLTGGAFTPAAGGFLEGWFLYSPDGGTSFEKANYASGTDLPRPPDFIIPFANVATAANDVYAASGICRMPWWTTKVYIGNRTGVALSASGHILKVGPVAIQY